MTQTTTGSENDAKSSVAPPDYSLIYEPITSANISSTPNQYCLHLSNTCDWDRIAAAGSNGDVNVFKLETMESVHSFNQGPVAGLKCSPIDPNIVWLGLKNGLIKLYDLRANMPQKSFRTAKKEPKTRPLTCIDVQNDRLLCGGTELTEDGAFVIFWDIKAGKTGHEFTIGKKGRILSKTPEGQILGSYSNSHMDDLTQVSFSPTNPDLLATSSTDGLINIFDLTHKSEDDAFTYCLNAGTAPEKLAWLSAGKTKQRLGALTSLEEFQYWDIKDSSPFVNFSRRELSDTLEHPQNNCYLVSADRLTDGSVAILAGGRTEPPEGVAGGVSEGVEEGDMLRSLKLEVSTGKITPYGAFLPRSRLLTTRTAVYNSSTDQYVTGGECGIIRLWKSKQCSPPGKKDKAKKKRNKPY